MRTIEGQSKDHGGTTSAMSSGAASGKGAAGPSGSHTQGSGPPQHVAQTKMAPMAMTSPIKIAAVHNRPQLQTISHPGGHSGHQDTNEDKQSQNSRIPYNSSNNSTNYKGIGASGGAGSHARKQPSGAITETTANTSSHDYNRNGAQKPN